MPCVEIWIRPRVVLDPTMADHTNIGIAHQELSQHFSAVTCHIGDRHYIGHKKEPWGLINLGVRER